MCIHNLYLVGCDLYGLLVIEVKRKPRGVFFSCVVNYSWLTTSTLFIPVWMASMFIGIILW